ncbi:putative Peptidase S41 [Seiridium cardinale]
MSLPRRAYDLPTELRQYVQFQSTLEAVKSPPSTYLSAATDILGGLDIIPSKISNNTYSSTDIFLLANSANDGHFSLDLCSLSIFASSLQAQTIASVSKAGLALSELYLFEDVQYIDSTNSTTVNVSSVANINGVDTFEYVPNIADLRRSQDPDSRWNQLYPSSAVLAAYDSTVIEFSEFSNGSNLTLETHASSAGSSFNVSSGVGIDSGRIFQNAIAGGIDLLTPDELEHLNPSILQPLEQFPPTLSGNLNFCDAYQERNPDLPLQFEYPAADCRLFYTYKNIRNPATTWLAASQAIRDNGSCVPASTGSRDLCRVVRTPTGGGDNSPGGGGVETSTVAFPAFSAYAFVFLLITVSWCLV